MTLVGLGKFEEDLCNLRDLNWLLGAGRAVEYFEVAFGTLAHVRRCPDDEVADAVTRHNIQNDVLVNLQEVYEAEDH